MQTATPAVRSVPTRHVSTSGKALAQRALALWQRLDRRALSRCSGDPARIARLVAHRTNLPLETIRAILDPSVSDAEGGIWFG